MDIAFIHCHCPSTTMRVFSIPIAIGIAGIIVAITIAPSAVAAADKQQQSGAGGDGAGVAKAQGPPPFFLQDSSDSLCFAGEDFRRCSVDTLFFVVSSPGSYRIHKRPQDNVDVDPDGTCVSKKSCDKIDPATVVRGDASGDASAAAAAATTDVKLAKCTHCGAKAWKSMAIQRRDTCSPSPPRGHSCASSAPAAGSTRASRRANHRPKPILRCGALIHTHANTAS